MRMFISNQFFIEDLVQPKKGVFLNSLRINFLEFHWACSLYRPAHPGRAWSEAFVTGKARNLFCFRNGGGHGQF